MLSPEQVEVIRHKVAVTTLFRHPPEDRRVAVDQAKFFVLPEESLQVTRQLETEATETNFALRMKDDL